jgi:hypothetical protein
MEFIINKFIKLKLEGGKTNIYVDGQKFIHCKSLITQMKIDEIKELNEIESIDELAYNIEDNKDIRVIDLPEETRFWAHCSNLQIWTENDYNTKLLHSDLAFPLLKRLKEVGDSIAERVFKEEIAKRFEDKHMSVILYLLSENFPKYYLSEEEISGLLPRNNLILRKNIKNSLDECVKREFNDNYPLLILELLIRDYNDAEAKNILREKFIETLQSENKRGFNYLINNSNSIDFMEEEELIELLEHIPLFLKIKKKDPSISEKFLSINKKLNKDDRKSLIESLLIILNYDESQKKICELIKEELNYRKYSKKIN